MRISNMTLAEKGLPATRQQITDNLFAALQGWTTSRPP